MVEAFLEATTGSVTIVVKDADDVQVGTVDAGRVGIDVLPALIYGTGRAHAADLRAFSRLLGRAHSVSVVGADIMDGHYNNRASTARATLAQYAAEAGVDTRILGFSWNDRSKRSARRALAAAADAGARLLIRDPRSAQRAQADGIRPSHQVADIVFAASRLDEPSTDSGTIDATPYALVNVSALVAGKIDLLDDYVEIVAGLRARGLRVILIPHVSRPSGDDIAACKVVADRFDGPGVTLVDRLLTPSRIRAIADGAALVVTGRMHLAIISLSRGVPALVLNTQGKVDGLAEVFHCPELCITPRRGLASGVLASVDDILSPSSRIRAALRERLPEVIMLSRDNTAELGSPL